MEYYYITVVIISLIFSALFSGVEIAFVSSNKLQIELQNKQGFLSGKILAKFLEKPSRFIGTTLVGNTISLVIYGIFMTYLLQPVLEQNLPQLFNNEATILVLQTIISTLIVLTLAEFTPKSFFLINPNWLLSVFAIPMNIIYYLMYPLVFVVVTLSRFMITTILGLKYSEDKPVFGLTDLNNFVKTTLKIDNAESKIDANTRIFNNALEFKTVRVRECMIPRTDIVAVDIEDDIKTLKEALIESGHSKILIYQESIDDIVGYCDSITLYKKPKDIASILSPILIVPETMLANELMIQFITEHKSIALVVDEFGGTSGLVTIEDIIEEIFGEIQDEHDVEDWV
ncbi:MAG: hemolysin family protein, partial [Chitinophagaceae bacterium]